MKRARELDGQGVRAFKDGRFKDAIIFFEEAWLNGAPPIELWNIAKCHIKLDEPEQAEDSFHAYLEQPDLTGQDRADATQELRDLRSRPSTIAIDSDPSGATFTIDGSATDRGTTPGSIDVAPGTHHIHVSKDKAAGVYDVDVDARLGRALIVRAKLGSKSDGIVSASPTEPPFDPDRDRTGLTFSEDFGFFASNLGGYGDSIRPVLHLAARYTFARAGAASFNGGVRFAATTDGWSSGAVAPPDPAQVTGCRLPSDFSAAELAGFFVLATSVHVHSRITLGADLGIGIAALEGSPTGGDLFAPDCNPSYGVRPAVHFGTEISFILTSPGPVQLRAIVEPIVFQAHDGYHAALAESDGLWWRIGPAVGFAVDL